MEQVGAPDQKPVGPLDQGPIRLLWIPWTLGATKEGQKGLFGDLQETMVLKCGSHWVPCSYMSEARDQTFFRFFLFFVRKMGPLLKNSSPYSNIFFILEGGGYPGAPSDLPLGRSEGEV